MWPGSKLRVRLLAQPCSPFLQGRLCSLSFHSQQQPQGTLCPPALRQAPRILLAIESHERVERLILEQLCSRESLLRVMAPASADDGQDKLSLSGCDVRPSKVQFAFESCQWRSRRLQFARMIVPPVQDFLLLLPSREMALPALRKGSHHGHQA